MHGAHMHCVRACIGGFQVYVCVPEVLLILLKSLRRARGARAQIFEASRGMWVLREAAGADMEDYFDTQRISASTCI